MLPGWYLKAGGSTSCNMKVKDLDDVFRDGIERVDSINGKDDYDPGKKQYRSILVPIAWFTLFITGAFVVGLFFDLPYMFSVSYFALAMAFVALIYNHWILNSIAIPVGMSFIPVAIIDAFFGNWYAFAVHLPTVIIVLALITRHDTGLVVMLLASAVFSMWVFTASNWIIDPYYAFIVAIMPPHVIGLITASGSVAISLVKTIVEWRYKEKGGKIDCGMGMCPL